MCSGDVSSMVFRDFSMSVISSTSSRDLFVSLGEGPTLLYVARVLGM